MSGDLADVFDTPVSLTDTFASEEPRFVRTVCDSRYVCQGSEEEGFRWVADESRTNQGVKGCRVDSLAAAATAIGSCRPPKDAPGACSATEPCLSDAAGHLHCFSQDSTTLPRVLDASWRCVDVRPTPTTHSKMNEEVIGDGLVTFVLKETPPVVPTSNFVSNIVSTIVSSVTPPSSEEAAIEVVPITATPPSSEQAWQTCDWFQGRTARACNVDADCPLDNAFDVWFDAASERMPKDGTKMSVHTFLQRVADDASKVDLAWSTTHPEVQRDEKVKKSTLRSRLESLHKKDATFRASVSSMLREEGHMRQASLKEREGACTSEKVCKRSVTHPTTLLYDGTERVAFQQTDDGEIMYVRGDEGVARRLRATSCDTSDAPSECRDAKVAVVDSRNMTPTLTTHATAEHYRLHFHGREGKETYLVGNVLEAYGTIDAQEVRASCAAQLCERNAAECPAPHCRIDESSGGCVADAARVPSVRTISS